MFKVDELYTLEMYNGRGGGDRDAYIDLLITGQGGYSQEIYFASIMGADKDVQQVAWLIQEGKTGRIRRAEGEIREEGHIIKNVHAHPKKNSYDEYDSKIDDITHKLLISKMIKPKTKERQNWMMEQERSNEHYEEQPLPDELAELIIAWDGDYKTQIFKVLNDRYGTPMIEDWKDYIVEMLIDEEYYKPLNVYSFGSNENIEAGLLKVTEHQLESIISEGIASYELDFAIMDDGRTEGVLKQCKTIDDYLTHFAGELGKRIQENIRTRFDPKRDAHHPAFRDVNLWANQQGLTGLFPPQADAVMGVSKTLIEDDYCFVVAEMG